MLKRYLKRISSESLKKELEEHSEGSNNAVYIDLVGAYIPQVKFHLHEEVDSIILDLGDVTDES